MQQTRMQMPPNIPYRQRMRREVQRTFLSVKTIFPKWLSQYSGVVYIMVLAVISLMYSSYSLPWYYMLSGIVAILAFFLYGSTLSKSLALEKIRREKSFERRILLLAFIPSLIWTIVIYIIFMHNYGDSFGFENADPLFYHEAGEEFAEAIRNGNFSSVWKEYTESIDVSDLGYATYVGFLYYLTDNSIIAVRLIKCILSAITVLLIYRLAKRNFGVQIARVTAIFCALWPNFWYYCGTHLKETEMVFLTVLFVEQTDQMLRSRQFTAWKVIPILLIAAVLYTFRTPLALVSLLALIFSVVMSSTKVVSWGKRVIVGLLAVILIGVTMGNRIQKETRMLVEQAQSSSQQENMTWRAEKKGGNAFAKYAGKSVFAPLIFTIPFPSMVRPFDGQDVQQLLNGGNFIKNIVSFFVIFSMFVLLLNGNWRQHLLPISFMLGYLLVLTMSNFAQSGRFHMPVMPFEFMFAAYGLSIAVTKLKYKRWFAYWCALMFVACIAWNWFKLAGRGLT